MHEKRINKRRIKRKGYSVGADITKNKHAEVYYRNALDHEIAAFLDSINKNIKLDFGNAEAILATMRLYENVIMTVLLDNSEKIIHKWLNIATKKADKSLREAIYGDLADSITINYDKAYDSSLKMIVQRNVALIKNTTTQTLTNIENIVFDSMTTGQGWYQTEKDLITQTHISRDKIKRIARDQTAKTNTALNYLTQKAAGIEYFEWRTANDERVSTGYGGHKQLNGKIFKWGDEQNYPIIDSYGHKGIPSQRPNCRCVALPVFVQKGFHLNKQSDGSYKIERD